MIAGNGYVKLRVGRDHPLADPNGYAYEHLVVWCAAGRSRPPLGWLIHHDNEVKTDNRLSNLKLITRAEHNRLHNAQRGRDEKTGRLIARAGYGDSFRVDSGRIDHQVFGWPLRDIERLTPPVPARGAQGFWRWTPEEVDHG